MRIAEINDVLTVPKAADELGITKVTLYEWIHADKVACVRIGGILFVPRTELDRLKKERNKQAAGA